MQRRAYIVYVSAYVLGIFAAAFPDLIMDSTTVELGPKAAGPLFWRRPEAASIMGYGKEANMSNKEANAYKIYACLRILLILRNSLYVAPAAIRSAESTVPGSRYLGLGT